MIFSIFSFFLLLTAFHPVHFNRDRSEFLESTHPAHEFPRLFLMYLWRFWGGARAWVPSLGPGSPRDSSKPSQIQKQMQHHQKTPAQTNTTSPQRFERWLADALNFVFLENQFFPYKFKFRGFLTTPIFGGMKSRSFCTGLYFLAQHFIFFIMHFHVFSVFLTRFSKKRPPQQPPASRPPSKKLDFVERIRTVPVSP